MEQSILVSERDFSYYPSSRTVLLSNDSTSWQHSTSETVSYAQSGSDPPITSNLHNVRSPYGPLIKIVKFIVQDPDLRKYSDTSFDPASLRFRIGEGSTYRVDSAVIRGKETDAPDPGEIVPGERVAIKRVKPYKDALETALLELRLSRHPPLAQHENILAPEGYGWDVSGGTTEPFFYLTARFSRFGTVKDFLDFQNEKGLGFRERVEFCLDIAKGLETLHACGIAHGDVKLENTLVFEREEDKEHRGEYVAKITDFGHTIVRDGKPYLGTRYLTAPELRSDETGHERRDISQNCASDMFSFGIMMWEIFADGKRYYKGIKGMPQNNPALWFEKTPESEFIRLALLSVSECYRKHEERDVNVERVRRALRGSLEYNPSKRYTAEQVVRCLSMALKHEEKRPPAHGGWNYKPPPAPRPLQMDADSDSETLDYLTVLKCNYLPQPIQVLVASHFQHLANAPPNIAVAASAMFALSACYEHGIGVDSSTAKMLEYLRSAAENGHLEAAQLYARVSEAAGANEGWRAIPDIRNRMILAAELRLATLSWRKDYIAVRMRIYEEEFQNAVREGPISLLQDNTLIYTARGLEDSALLEKIASNMSVFQKLSLTSDVLQPFSHRPFVAPVHCFFARFGAKSLLQSLLSLGVALSDNSTLLYSFKGGQFSTAKYLLSLCSTMDPTISSTVSWKADASPLQWLFMFPTEYALELLKDLLDRGYDIEAEGFLTHIPINYHITRFLYRPLHVAIAFNLEELALAFVRYGACFEPASGDTTGEKQITAAHVALMCHLPDLAAYFLNLTKSGYEDVWADLLTLPSLTLRLLHGKELRKKPVELVELLISRGADVNALDEDGNTALARAIMNAHNGHQVFFDLLRVLVSHGAKISYLHLNTADSVVRLIDLAPASQQKLITEFLLENEVITTDHGGASLLHAAALRGVSGAVEGILSFAKLHPDKAKKCDVNGHEVDETGSYVTPLISSIIFKGHAKTVRILLKNGADVNKEMASDGTHYSPLSIALMGPLCDGEVLDILLDAGAEIYAPFGTIGKRMWAFRIAARNRVHTTGDGKHALFRLFRSENGEKRHPAVVKAFLDHADGSTPEVADTLAISIAKGDFEALEALLDTGLQFIETVEDPITLLNTLATAGTIRLLAETENCDDRELYRFQITAERMLINFSSILKDMPRLTRISTSILLGSSKRFAQVLKEDWEEQMAREREGTRQSISITGLAQFVLLQCSTENFKEGFEDGFDVIKAAIEAKRENVMKIISSYKEYDLWKAFEFSRNIGLGHHDKFPEEVEDELRRECFVEKDGEMSLNPRAVSKLFEYAKTLRQLSKHGEAIKLLRSRLHSLQQNEERITKNKLVAGIKALQEELLRRAELQRLQNTLQDGLSTLRIDTQAEGDQSDIQRNLSNNEFEFSDLPDEMHLLDLLAHFNLDFDKVLHSDEILESIRRELTRRVNLREKRELEKSLLETYIDNGEYSAAEDIAMDLLAEMLEDDDVSVIQLALAKIDYSATMILQGKTEKMGELLQSVFDDSLQDTVPLPLATLTGVWRLHVTLIEVGTCKVDIIGRLVDALTEDDERSVKSLIKQFVDSGNSEYNSFASRVAKEGVQYGKMQINYTKIFDAISLLAAQLERKEQYDSAEKCRKLVYFAFRKIFGRDSHHTHIAMDNCIRLLAHQARYEEVVTYHEEYLQMTMQRRKDINDPAILEVLGRLAPTYSFLGRYVECEIAFRRITDAYRSLYGDGHPETIYAARNLAKSLWNCGEFSKAEEVCRRVLSTLNDIGKESYTDEIIEMLKLISEIECGDGRWENAVKTVENALAVATKANEKTNRYTEQILDLSNLLVTSKLNADDYESAEALAKGMIENVKESFGVNSIRYFVAQESLAKVYTYRMEEKIKESIELLRGAYFGRMQLLGRNLEDTISTLIRLCILLWVDQDYDSIIDLVNPALSVFGEKSKQYYHLKCFLGRALYEEGSSESDELAISAFMEIIDEGERVLGETHPAFRQALYSLALIYRDCGKPNKARNSIERLIPIASKMKDVDDAEEGGPTWLNVVTTAAEIYRDFEEWVDAAKCETIAWNLRKDAWGEADEDTLAGMEQLIYCKEKMEDWPSVANLREEFLRIITENGKDTGELASAMQKLGEVYIRLNKWEEGEGVLRRALEHVNGSGQAYELKSKLATCLSELSRLQEAEVLQSEVVQFFSATCQSTSKELLLAKAALGRTYQRMGRLFEAVALLTDTLSNSSECLSEEEIGTIKFYLSEALYQQGRLTEALASTSEAVKNLRNVEASKDRLPVLRLKAKILRALGMHGELRKCMEDIDTAELMVEVLKKIHGLGPTAILENRRVGISPNIT